MADREKETKASAKHDQAEAVWQLVASAPDAVAYRAFAVFAETVGPCPAELLGAVQSRGRELGA